MTKTTKTTSTKTTTPAVKVVKNPATKTTATKSVKVTKNPATKTTAPAVKAEPAKTTASSVKADSAWTTLSGHILELVARDSKSSVSQFIIEFANDNEFTGEELVKSFMTQFKTKSGIIPDEEDMK